MNVLLTLLFLCLSCWFCSRRSQGALRWTVAHGTNQKALCSYSNFPSLSDFVFFYGKRKDEKNGRNMVSTSMSEADKPTVNSLPGSALNYGRCLKEIMMTPEIKTFVFGLIGMYFLLQMFILSLMLLERYSVLWLFHTLLLNPGINILRCSFHQCWRKDCFILSCSHNDLWYFFPLLEGFVIERSWLMNCVSWLFNLFI